MFPIRRVAFALGGSPLLLEAVFGGNFSVHFLANFDIVPLSLWTS